MNETDKINLTEQTKIRLDKMTEIEDYFTQLIRENHVVKNLANMLLFLIT